MKLPTVATLYMGSNCNFKCDFCYRQSNEIEHLNDMTVEVVKDVVKALPSIKSFCLCGYCEPLMNKNIDEILRYLKENKYGMSIITNGFLLSSKIELLKKYRPSYISVSLNASNADLHFQNTKTKDSFDTVIESISLCVKNNIETYFTYVCTKQNLYDIIPFLSLTKKLKVKGVYLFNTLPHCLIREETANDFLKYVLTLDDKERIDEIKKSSNSDIVLSYPILIDLKNQKRCCKFAWKQLSIDSNGSISLCNSIFPPDKSNGSIYDANILSNEYCENFRKNLSSSLACQYCWRNFE